MTDHPHLEALRARHRDLDSEIAQEQKRPGYDPERIIQMKRKKLRLKEEIESFSK